MNRLASEPISPEEAARLDAEAAERRLAFLYDTTTAIFSAPIDVQTRLERLAAAVVPEIADWCVIELLEEGRLRRAAVARWNPAGAEVEAALPARSLLSENPLVEWAVTRLTTVGPLSARDFFEPHVPAALRTLGAHSFVVVPLVLGSTVFGAATLAYVESMREHDPDDVALATDICARAAQALESARLFTAEQDAKQRAEEAQRRAEEAQRRAEEAQRAIATALARESRTLARLDALLESAPVGVAFCDRDLRYVLVNSALSEIHGVPVEAHVGRSPAELMPDVEGMPQLMDAWRRIVATGEPMRDVELSGAHPEQPEQRRHLRASWFPVREQERVVGVGAVVEDVTEQKEGELERARLLEQLEEAVQARDAFLSAASHDLRTPLSVLMLHLEALKRRADPETALPRVEKALEVSQRLVDLIDELLDVTRIQAGRLSLKSEPVDLARVVEQVVERYAEEASRRGSRISLDVEGSVIGSWDRLRLEQVATNLVSNAIKYGEGRPIRVKVERGETHGRLIVEDQGVGIPQEAQQRIFERFERAVASSSISGLGVGLWIVNQIVEATGGSIHVDSEPGRGSTFVVELPLEPPAQPNEA